MFNTIFNRLKVVLQSLDNTNFILNNNLDYSNIDIDDISTILNNAENLIQKKIGKKKDKMWNYFHIIDIPNNPHKGAICKFYLQS